VFVDCYKAAKQSEKKYKNLLKEIASDLRDIRKRGHGTDEIWNIETKANSIQSLSTTTPIDFEVEMEVKLGYGAGTGEIRPKVINNVLQGTWRFK
jgi:hypothetical protein